MGLALKELITAHKADVMKRQPIKSYAIEKVQLTL
jgi:hypothetical protein